jgi:hypothetical protein
LDTCPIQGARGGADAGATLAEAHRLKEEHVARRKLVRSTVSTLIAGAAALTALIAPAGASAGALVASAPDCDGQALSQPFAPWLDPSQYTLNAGGDFESAASGWALDGGATVVAGNEPYHVTGADDSSSLKLPSGASATSSTICVGLEHPTLRLFARRATGFVATMSVEVLFEDATGEARSLTIGSVTGTGSWQPTSPMAVVANLLPLLPGEHTPVQFRFSALNGGLQIDDVYVDPRHNS